jgi:hypothetical protein
MHPKIGYEHILLGLNRFLYASKEKRSNPGDLAKLSLDTPQINIRNRGSMLNALPKPAVIAWVGEIPDMIWIREVFKALISFKS